MGKLTRSNRQYNKKMINAIEHTRLQCGKPQITEKLRDPQGAKTSTINHFTGGYNLPRYHQKNYTSIKESTLSTICIQQDGWNNKNSKRYIIVKPALEDRKLKSNQSDFLLDGKNNPLKFQRSNSDATTPTRFFYRIFFFSLFIFSLLCPHTHTLESHFFIS